MKRQLFATPVTNNNEIDLNLLYQPNDQVNCQKPVELTNVSHQTAFLLPALNSRVAYRMQTRTTDKTKTTHATSNGRANQQNKKNSSDSHVAQMADELRDITTLYNLGVNIGISLSLTEVISKLYKESSHLIDTSNFALVTYNESLDRLNFRLIRNQNQLVPTFLQRHSDNPALASQVLVNQKPLLIPDLQHTNHQFEIRSAEADTPIRSVLAVPIIHPTVTGDPAQGVIIRWSYEPDAFNERDVWLLSAIATQAAIAIRNAQLFEDSQRRALEMAVLNDVAHLLTNTLDLNEVLTRIMEQVAAMLDVEAGYLLLKDVKTDDLISQASLDESARPFRIPQGQGIAGQVMMTGQSMIITEPTEESLARQVLGVPLTVHHQVIGVLAVTSQPGGCFSQHDVELLSSIASFAGVAIENARLHENVLIERDRVTVVQEEARRALARDLHDGPTQLVAGLQMCIEFCQAALAKEPALVSGELQYMHQLTNRTMHQMRTVLFELRPLILETEGLLPALQVFLDRRQQGITAVQATKISLQVESSSSNGQVERQDEKIEAALFAIVQEAVNNAIKYAHADQIVVHLRDTPTKLEATIKDDGQGFDVEQVMATYEERGSLGMVNIQERVNLAGGEFSIKSTPKQGTEVSVQVPKASAERQKKRIATGPLSLRSR